MLLSIDQFHQFPLAVDLTEGHFRLETVGDATKHEQFLPALPVFLAVDDVVQFSKSHKDKKNNNIYALVGNKLDIYCLGMVKEQTPKYNGKIFLGQKVYATSKEELCLYYKEAVKKHRKIVDAAMKRAEQYLTNLDSDTNLIYNKFLQKLINRPQKTIPTWNSLGNGFFRSD